MEEGHHHKAGFQETEDQQEDMGLIEEMLCTAEDLMEDLVDQKGSLVGFKQVGAGKCPKEDHQHPKVLDLMQDTEVRPDPVEEMSKLEAPKALSSETKDQDLMQDK